MKFILISILILFFTLAPAHFSQAEVPCTKDGQQGLVGLNGECIVAQGTSPVGGSCIGNSNCIPGLVCTNNVCQNQSPSPGGSPGQPPGQPIKLINPLGDGVTLNGFLVSILDLVIYIGSVVVILMLVYVGYLFVVAQGNESKLTEARKALLYTIVGALILLGSKAIAMGIQATLQAISTGN